MIYYDNITCINITKLPIELIFKIYSYIDPHILEKCFHSSLLFEIYNILYNLDKIKECDKQYDSFWLYLIHLYKFNIILSDRSGNDKLITNKDIFFDTYKRLPKRLACFYIRNNKYQNYY